MASIICGACKDRHASVEDVRECHAPEPQEVTCFSCDCLIGYDIPWIVEGERRGCGGPGICRLDFPASF